jgi:SAM-dependent methyltransferase
MRAEQMHGSETPSAWAQRWAHLMPGGGTVLDVACGRGRHVRWLAARGHAVTALDRDSEALNALQSVAECVQADIETGPWPLPGRRFDAVLVTHYLWRPLLPTLCDCLAEGGVLIYETFADGQQHIGRPSRPDFLLQPGELLQAFVSLRVVAFEDGFEALPAPGRCMQRIAAVRSRPGVPALQPPPAKMPG